MMRCDGLVVTLWDTCCMHSYCSSVDGGIGTVLKVTRIYSDGGVTLAVVWYV